MVSLRHRARAEEQMDDPGLDHQTYAAVLRDLSRVNRWTFAARPTLNFLNKALRGAKRFRLLDVGFGQGDMLRAIAAWAERRHIEADLVGVDLNPRSAPAARAATPSRFAIDYRTGDYREVGKGFDFIFSSLVAHHMSAGELSAFIRYMEAEAEKGWLINDLHRHRLAYTGYPILARLLDVHPIVRADGTLSIARSFRPFEWRAILAEAGIEEGAAGILRRFPFRLCVERLR